MGPSATGPSGIERDKHANAVVWGTQTASRPCVSSKSRRAFRFSGAGIAMRLHDRDATSSHRAGVAFEGRGCGS
jgi:hypothetical protein